MKHTFSTLFLLLTFVLSYPQQTSISKEAYLTKSKKQKTAAWIMLGGGSALFIGGLIAESHRVYNEDADPLEEITNTKVSAAAVMGTVGLLVAVGSIPVFIASSRNKRKATSVSLKNELTQRLIGNTLALKYIPSVSLKLAL